MCLKENMKSKWIPVFTLLVFTVCCTTFEKSLLPNKHFITSGNPLFTLPEAVFPPSKIQSLQLRPENNHDAAPVISLNGSVKLILSFDYLSKQAKQFRISVSHHSKSWNKSPLPPTAYTASFFETYFGGGVASFAANPVYRHYEYRFPNERLALTKSGNYLLSVYDYNTDELLFRIPFFITEDQGTFQTELRNIFGRGTGAINRIQPFSIYRYPAFITQPRFDLSASYVPNQFWGRAKTADQVFYAGNGEIRFHLSRDQTFRGYYALNKIDLRAYPPRGREVLKFNPVKTPPAIILKRDVQPFSTISPFLNPGIMGPLADRRSRYLAVHFQFEPADRISPSASVYIVGDFTNWAIDERFRMHFDVQDSLWKGKALVKQGAYTYKYMLIENGRMIETSPHQSFTNYRKMVLTLIYYRDPELHYDRLLKVGKTLYR